MATLKEDFADLRAHIGSLPIIGRRITVLHLLDFTDEAIKALEAVHGGGSFCPYPHHKGPVCRAAHVLAKLDEER
jgi:hypothetical protein